MGISFSVFSNSGSSSASGFNLDVGSSGNTTFEFSSPQPAGSYSITSQLSDATIEFYAINSQNVLVGYTNSKSISTTEPFSRMVVYGASTNDLITFEFKPTTRPSISGNADGGAPAYVDSVSQTDLPNIDDTTIISGGNFATDVEVSFRGTNNVSYSAKSIIRTSSSQLIVTRPDEAINDYAPYTITVVNPGIPQTTIKTFTRGSITTGADPVWVSDATVSWTAGQSQSIDITASDSDGTIVYYELVSGSLPSGFSIAPSGQIVFSGDDSGFEAGGPNATFTVRAVDSGDNIIEKEFSLYYNTPPVWQTEQADVLNAGTSSQYFGQLLANGSSASSSVSYSVVSGSLPAGLSLNSETGAITGQSTESFNTSRTFTVRAEDNLGAYSDKEFSLLTANPQFFVDYLVVGGGGGGGGPGRGGGGGAGGYRTNLGTSGRSSSSEPAFISSLSTSYSVQVGAGGAAGGSEALGADGGSSTFATITSLGGGGGAANGSTGRDGGSGSGASNAQNPGLGTEGQGYDGQRGVGSGSNYPVTWSAGGGGGAGNGGGNRVGGDGIQTPIDNEYYAGGGGGGGTGRYSDFGGLGGGGYGGTAGWGGVGYRDAAAGVVNTGGGGGGGGCYNSCVNSAAGGSGIVLLRYPSVFNISTSGVSASTSVSGSYKITRITSGSGNVSWS